MVLSYILHGHVPFYSSETPHPDSFLHAKLVNAPCLLRSDLDALTHHFAASRMSYVTQALPVNVLLDTLLRPNGDTDDLGDVTNLRWEYNPHLKIPHLVLGDAPTPGGLWAVEDPARVSWDIQTLSYAGLLSLPGYTFADHYRKVKKVELAPFTRPSRRDLADYLRDYPAEVGIKDVFHNGARVEGIERTEDGFYIHSHGISCKRLVLATGIFSHIIRPPPLLLPLTQLPGRSTSGAPLLVIGSGFTAADVIISTPPDQPILHLFRWDPDNRPSPLRSGHQQAYPEYAGVYRLMKRAAMSSPGASAHAKTRKFASTPFLKSRNWDEVYEGLANCEVIDVAIRNGEGTVTLRLPDENGTTIVRRVCGLAYTVGRRGTLDYLHPSLRAEVLDGAGELDNGMVTPRTLRNKAMEDLEVAPGVFVIGSLTGDSLIRYAYGGCVHVASTLMDTDREQTSSGASTPKRPAGTPTGGQDALLNGIDGHGGPVKKICQSDDEANTMNGTKRSPDHQVGSSWIMRKWWNTFVNIFSSDS